MADNSRIEWTDASWNPLRARNRATGKVGWFCVHVSEGCRNCYAEGFNRRLGTGVDYKPQALKAGHIEVFLDLVMLTQPLRWKKPRRIFVGSMTDLFADFVTDAWLDQIFAVMALSPQHTFQILTKRPERMRDYLTTACGRIADTIIRMRRERGDKDMVVGPLAHLEPGATWWPLANVWLDVSVEDQARAIERVSLLMMTPAAVRWISAEPLLGPVDLRRLRFSPECNSIIDALVGHEGSAFQHRLEGIDWVVAGGESGPGARPMHPDWTRQLRDQCADAAVPFLFKQWGDWAAIDAWAPADRRPQLAIAKDGRRVDDDVAPEDVPGGQRLMQIGKKTAGRLLDGQMHDAFPEARP